MKSVLALAITIIEIAVLAVPVHLSH